MKNEPSIWKVHRWRRELTLLVIGTFSGIMQREKLLQERDTRVRNFARMKEVSDAVKLSVAVKNEGGFRCSQEWEKRRELTLLVTSTNFPMQSPETTAGSWVQRFSGEAKRENSERMKDVSGEAVVS